MRLKSLFKITFAVILTPLIYLAYLIFIDANRSPHTEESSDSSLDFTINSPVRKPEQIRLPKSLKKSSKKVKYPKHEIEIWGKASIAEYLWGHILEGNSTLYANGLIKHGEIAIDNLYFRFRSGPGIIQNTVPSGVKNLVLILNGMDETKIRFGTYWLKYLRHYEHLKNVALVLLGDEKCDNTWLLPYKRSNGGVIDIVFIVYDNPLIDNKTFYHWPLGVATYRGFPNIKPNQVNVESSREYKCNFLGTIYKNSSREVLNNYLKKTNKCFVLSRDTWVPVETYDSMAMYIDKLSRSDLTLSPVGRNTECYRIYEALSVGSVPVVEDAHGSKTCEKNSEKTLKLLKKHNAPIIYVKDWSELEDVLKNEEKLSLEEIVLRRKTIIEWYDKFKKSMKDQFVKILKKQFFSEE